MTFDLLYFYIRLRLNKVEYTVKESEHHEKQPNIYI